MKKLISFVCAAVIGASTIMTASVPVGADPMRVNGNGPGGFRNGGLGHHGWRNHGGGRHHGGWNRGAGYGYYNGHRGYRAYRPGYREHNGFWFPAAAFLGAAIIGGALAQPHYQGSAHVRSCYSRYKSYRASDNTYQPLSGPRAQCR